MSEQTKKVLDEALRLPPIKRAALVEEILSSFDFPARQAVDALWANEAEERIDAYERRQLNASPAKAVFDRLEGQKSE